MPSLNPTVLVLAVIMVFDVSTLLYCTRTKLNYFIGTTAPLFSGMVLGPSDFQ
jgi:hypothetical protein